MKCSVYIATSVDGFIATKNGGVDWLHIAGNYFIFIRKISSYLILYRSMSSDY